MKISLNWIKDYVELPKNMDMDKLAYDLTMSTVEVENVKYLSENFENIVVGIIKEVYPHPNADKLRICKTCIGGNELYEIVCGGTNLKPEMKVIVARPGARVRWHGEGDLVEIKKIKLRGVESYGMICAACEVGLADLFPPSNEGEIVDLSDFDVSAGSNVAEALGLNDVILEIDNKSLTNRPDLWGHYGIAREIAALYDLKLKNIAPFSAPKVKILDVNLIESKRCRRYIGAKLSGINMKSSPFEIKKRIWSAGLKPTNAVIDITNYVMLAVGQPVYAFDADKVNGAIIIRCAKDSEKIKLSDGKQLSLSSSDLVTCDNDGLISLAGILGEEKYSIDYETSNIIVEIANYAPSGIRHTEMRHELRTESAARFEKGLDPQRCDMAISLLFQIFGTIFENMSIVEYSDIYAVHLPKKEIDISLAWLESCIGKHIENDYIVCKLEKLGFKVEFNSDNMHVLVPSWRATGDISLKNDIMEEVARMYGFENFEPLPIKTSFNIAINQPKVDLDRKIREYLAFRCGMNEIFTYPWVNNKYSDALCFDKHDMLSIISPPSADECYVRSSLLPNLCKAVSKNLRNFSEFNIFESAQVFFNRNFESKYDSREVLPMQRKNIAGACVDEPKNLFNLFRRTKGILEAMPKYVHMEPLTFKKINRPDWADDVVWLNVFQEKETVGNFALLSKKSAITCGIKKSVVMLFELDIDLLKPYKSRTNEFKHLAEYPMVDYDLSLLFDLSVKWEDILDTLSQIDNQLIHKIRFVDEYTGEQIPEHKKSVTIRLLIGSFEKTLTSKEIKDCIDVVIDKLKISLGGELRD